MPIVEYRAVELIPGLIAGCVWRLDEVLEMQPDVLVPLEALPARVWEKGFRGEILFYPIAHGSVLPDEILDRLIGEIVERVHAGKRVAILGIGGRGRTCYVAACALFQLGVREPEPFLRKNYAPRPLDNPLQAQSVEHFCGGHICRTYWNCVQVTKRALLRDSESFREDADVLEEFRSINEELGDRGRFIIRPSGPLPEIRLTVEAPGEDLCEKLLSRMLTVLFRKGHLVEVLD